MTHYVYFAAVVSRHAGTVNGEVRHYMHSGDCKATPDSKVHGANMGPTWVLSAPDRPHIGPMNFAIWGVYRAFLEDLLFCKEDIGLICQYCVVIALVLSA